jgi:hypothetical protein
MSMIVPWLLFPVVLGLLSLGCGLLLEQAAGNRLSPALVLPAGFAVIVVVALVTTTNATTAQLTTPAVVALAVAGLALSLPLRVRRTDGWAIGSAGAAYLAFGAPVILTGSATFAGYITLDDTSSWLAFTDRLLEHGRNLTGLAPSSYEAALNYYWNENGYPAGAFPPLGVLHTLLGTDSAWLFQPYIAFLGALLALALYGITEPLIESRRLRALAVFVAAQPALLYAYSLWGGVKEVASAGLFVLVAALTPAALRARVPARSLLPLAVATSALIGVLSFGSAVWIAPVLIPAMVVGLRLRGRRFVRVAAIFAALGFVLSVPSLLLARGFLNDTSSTLTKETELGNLIHPLSKLQFFGIWPVGDFRLRPSDMTPTYLLIGVLIAAGLAGLAWAWRRRAWGFALYTAAAIVGCTAAVAVGSPWIDGKALAIASPAALVAAMAGAAWLFQGGRRVEAAVLAAAITGGVLWSNALAYHDAWLAPRSQLRELELIGKEFSGQGPTLMTEYQPYGVRHFLRHTDPEGAAELRRRPILLRTGLEVPKGGYADIDQFQLEGVLVYRTLVLVRSPSSSRPPSVYQLVQAGRYYDVWQRPEPPTTRILDHVPLGNDLQPAAASSCGDVLRLAGLATRGGGRLATVVRPPVSVVELGPTSHSSTWQAFSGNPDVVYPSRSGTLETSVTVPTTGHYGVWLGGSFRRRLQVSIDGRRLAGAHHQLTHLGVDTPLGDIDLRQGSHDVALKYSASDLSPGSGGAPFPMGPLVLSRDTAELPVTYVEPGTARSLCGRSLDWVEAVSG